jgi:hypothetical protein
VGSQVLGEITQIGKVSKGKRTEGILNVNFSPTRDVSIEFKELVLPGGKHLPIETAVSPGTEEVVHLVSTPEKEPEKKNAASKEIELTSLCDLSASVRHSSPDGLKSALYL